MHTCVYTCTHTCTQPCAQAEMILDAFCATTAHTSLFNNHVRYFCFLWLASWTEQGDKLHSLQGSPMVISPRHALFDTCETFLLSYMTQHLKPNRASDFREDSSSGMVMILTVVHVRSGSFYFFWVFPVEGNALWGPCSLFLILANKLHIGNTVYFLMEINFFGWIFCYDFLFSRSLCVPQRSLPWLVLILSPSPPSTSLVLPLP